MAAESYPARSKYGSEAAADHYQEGRFVAAVDEREQGFVRRLAARCRPLETVLDSPCGVGRMTALFPEQRVTALDISRSMLSSATRRAKAEGVVGEIEALPFATGSFDLVLSVRFLHHLPSEAAVSRCLGELARVSRRYVLVSYYDSFAVQQWRRTLKRWLRNRQSHRYGRPWRTFKALAAARGLRPVQRLCSMPWVSEQWFVLFEKEP